MNVEARIVRWLLWGAALGVVCGLIYALRGVLTPIFFAFMLAYVLDPVVDRFEAVGVPRAAGISVLLVGVLGLIALFMVLVVPTIVEDVVGITQQLPATFAAWMRGLQSIARSWGVELPESWGDMMERFGGDVSTLTKAMLAPLTSVVRGVLGSTASMLSAMSALVMIPVFSFYLLHDFDLIVARAVELVPPRLRGDVATVTREIDLVLSQFMRGQLTVMAILAGLYGAAYSLAGVSLAIPIGIVAGLLSFIPYVGGASALVLALMMVALHWTGWAQVVAVVGAYTVIQVLEGFVITPRIVGDKLGLSPVWVLFSMLAGAELFGFAGVLLSLPAAAVIKVFVLRGLGAYLSSAFFGGPVVEAGIDTAPTSTSEPGLAQADTAHDPDPGASTPTPAPDQDSSPKL